MKNQKHKPDLIKILLALLAMSCLTGAAELVDPTRPPDALIPSFKKLSANGPLKLNAVFLHPDRRVAIISNQIATTGDEVGAYTIINIQRDTVELRGSEETPVNLMLVPSIRTNRTVN